MWPLVALLAAVVPVAGVFSLGRVFFIRDLTMFFWGRHLWLRRSLLSGEWPLWDPSASGGQSAVADALNQMFLLPVLAVRLLGNEVVGFNLWVALPFPVAALGTYLFLRARFSPVASSLGAIAFAVSGPVISSGNFPNLSWSVAAMPWLLWAVDRCLRAPSRRSVATLALVFAGQILAGEPVSMSATAGVALAHALCNGLPEGAPAGRRWRAVAAIAAGMALGALISAVQMLPLESAVKESWRAAGVSDNFWSLHPLALAETVSVHLFGDYFQHSNLLTVPWMPVLNSGRDPFFYSIYFGTTLLTLATFGGIAGWRRTWSAFWASMLVVAVLAASGPYTPFYPFAQAHLPVVGSFRYPVKYLLVASLALAALVASGWDALASDERRNAAPGRYRWARAGALAFAGGVAGTAYLLSFVSLYFPAFAARQFFAVAKWLGIADPIAGAAFMLRALPSAATRMVFIAVGAVILLWVGSLRRKEARFARAGLFALLAVDLVVSNSGINPTTDVALFAPPRWVEKVAAHRDAPFYFGGKTNGTLDWQDPDGAQLFERPADLSAAEGRAAVSNEAVFFPAARGIREIFAYDLPVLWPRAFDALHRRFLQADQVRRDRFLANTGVRFRLLRPERGAGRPPLADVRYIRTLSLYDWGPEVAPRAGVVTEPRLLPGIMLQIDAMFDPAFDARRMVVLERLGQPEGAPGLPAQPAARVVRESNGRVELEASAPAAGGFLVLLDSYSPDWKVTVDGKPGTVLRANVVSRAVALAPGRHVVEFRYRPKVFYEGAAISALGLLLAGGLFVRRRPQSC